MIILCLLGDPNFDLDHLGDPLLEDVVTRGRGQRGGGVPSIWRNCTYY